MFLRIINHHYFVKVVLLLLCMGAILWGWRTNLALSREHTETLNEVSELQAERAGLLEVIREQNKTIKSFGGQIESLGSVVEKLEKLSATDPELLKKYSKIYFLNENYVPPNLVDIDEKYAYNKKDLPELRGDVWVRLRSLLSHANDDGSGLLVASAYRSFERQADLKSAYTVTYGSDANKFSADQGYSEHQLGTTVDFTTTSLGANFSKFAADKAYTWLLANAYRYGFILSYPQGNNYYVYEPWHWRYVGLELSTRLHNEGKNFYDLDQREIDKYLINLFD